jgi:iron-sulfur cluster repair protein YtfE (RIC family)
VDAGPGARTLVLVPEDKVATAALRSPDALLVLQRFGIDICCGGHLTLAQAAASAGVPVQTFLRALDALAPPETT